MPTPIPSLNSPIDIGLSATPKVTDPEFYKALLDIHTAIEILALKSVISGKVNIAAGGTSVVITNDLIKSTSRVFAVASTNDATARVTSVVPVNGSLTIRTVACTGITSFDYFFIN